MNPEQEIQALYNAILSVGVAFFWVFIVAVLIAILAAAVKDPEDRK